MSETPNRPGTTRRRAPGWMRAALFASLAVNLLIVGLVAGALVRGAPDRDGDRRPLVRDLGLGPFADALPVRDRLALGRDLARDPEGLRANREAVRQQFEAFLDLVRADTFDAEAARALIGAQQTRLMEVRGVGRDLLIDRLAGMAPDARRAYADRLSALLRRPPRPPRPPRD
jgi:uncharacterized membrane protein